MTIMLGNKPILMGTSFHSRGPLRISISMSGIAQSSELNPSKNRIIQLRRKEQQQKQTLAQMMTMTKRRKKRRKTKRKKKRRRKTLK